MAASRRSTGQSPAEQLADAIIRHQIGLLRNGSRVSRQVIELLDATEADLRIAIRERLRFSEGMNRPSDVRRLRSLLQEIRETRGAAWVEVRQTLSSEMNELASSEAAFIDRAVKTALPVTVDTTLPSPARLRQIAVSQPFRGRVLRDWASRQQASELQAMQTQIQVGLTEGESIPQITRRVVGTVSSRGQNGATQATRRGLESIVRTASNHVGNEVRRVYYRQNRDILDFEMYLATLDSRTTPVCRALDGQRFPDLPGHFSCRSVRVPAFDGEVIGTRPLKAATEGRLLREFAAERGISAPSSRVGLPRGTKGAFDSFSRRRVRELTEVVPANTSYADFLRRQPASVQDDILGKTKGRLFRRGGLQLDRFVDQIGNERTLAQLARSDRQAFIDAGLDPDNF